MDEEAGIDTPVGGLDNPVAEDEGSYDLEEETDPESDDDDDPPQEPPTAAEIVQAGVARGQIDSDSIPVDRRELDEAKEGLIQHFASESCKCDFGPNHCPCCTSITVDHFRSVRCEMAELTHDELDLVVMGQVMAGCFRAETFRKQERSRSFTVFHHNGKRICQKTFLFLHTIGYWRFKALKASYLENGVVPRVHGNKGKSRSKLRLTLKEIEDVVQFILNYAGVWGERERERQGDWDLEEDKEGEGEISVKHMIVCVHVHVHVVIFM